MIDHGQKNGVFQKPRYVNRCMLLLTDLWADRSRRAGQAMFCLTKTETNEISSRKKQQLKEKKRLAEICLAYYYNTGLKMGINGPVNLTLTTGREVKLCPDLCTLPNPRQCFHFTAVRHTLVSSFNYKKSPCNSTWDNPTKKKGHTGWKSNEPLWSDHCGTACLHHLLDCPSCRAFQEDQWDPSKKWRGRV